MSVNRRNFVKGGAMVAVGSTALGSVMTAAQAHAEKMPLRVISPDEQLTLASLGEVLVPGSEQAGLVHFVDHQLSVDPNDCLLMAKYFQVKPPYVDFYRAGFKALNAACTTTWGKAFNKLAKAQAEAVVESLFDGSIEGWQGPPAALFYLLVRSDAVDVVYGTPEGFEKLSLPYMAHIMPPEGWS